MLGSNHAAGSRVSTRGQHDKYYSPQRTQLPIASPSTTAGPQQSVHSENNGIFGSITHLVRGATPPSHATRPNHR